MSDLPLPVRALGWLSAVAPGFAAARARDLFLRPRRAVMARLPSVARPADEVVDVAPGLVARRYGQGPRVLLVHGWEGGPGQFADLIDRLVAAGFSAIALDLPAHGDSAGRELTIPEAAEAILAAGRHSGALHAVVAHSLGGAATLRAAAAGLPAGRIVVVGAPTRVEGHLKGFAAALGFGERAVAAFLRAVEARVGVPTSGIDLASHAERIAAPTLVVHDRADREVPAIEGWRAQRLLPGSRLIETDGLGHRRILRDPATLDVIVGFVAAAQPTARAA